MIKLSAIVLISLFGLGFTLPVSMFDQFVLSGDMFVPNPFQPRNANIKTTKWPNGVIPYDYDAPSAFTAAEKLIITNSMKKISEQTNNCITFVPRTTEQSYIIFNATSTGCNSYVGKVFSSQQRVSIERAIGCIDQGVIVHELLHAVGFEHEQCRSDRDDYVIILPLNIQAGFEFAMAKMATTQVSTLDLPYDYYSIMHYRWDAFSSNGRATVLPKDPTIDYKKIGIRKDMSPLDIEKVKKFYGCPI